MGAHVRKRTSRKASALGLLALLALALLAAGCSATNAGAWEQMTDADTQNVLALARDTSNTRLVYAGGQSGIVYRALSDHTRVPLTSAGIPSNVVILALVSDPQQGGAVYAGTSDGLYVSTDFGESWRARGQGFPSDDSMDALLYVADQHALFAGTTQNGVYVSVDRGQTWQPAGNGLPTHANINTLFWQATTHTLYAAVDGVGLFASTDGGASWAARGTGLPPQEFALIELPDHGVNATSPTLYTGTNKGLFASTDSGQTWTAVGTGIPAGRVLSLAADPQVPGSLYAGTDTTIYHSLDGGRTWTLLAEGLHHQITAILVMPGTPQQPVIFAGAGGLVRYPPVASAPTSPWTVLVNILIVGALGLALIYIFMRSRRQIRDIDRDIRARTQETVSAKQQPTTTYPGERVPPPPPPRSNRRSTTLRGRSGRGFPTGGSRDGDRGKDGE